ncbi:MAG TPA: PDZ domain-containing protein [Candidatus Binatia bacterium]|nr:PDZ domain-containing protein [Candidatus Binatia bacterium]
MPVTRYTVHPADPAAHRFRVGVTVEQPDPQGQVFALPAWIRGSYLVRDFAKHVSGLSARDAGGPVAWQRLDKTALRCAPCQGPLSLEYDVYAYDDSVRKAFLDTRRGFFNGSSLLYRPVGRERDAVELVLQRPPAPFAHWRAATAMTPAAVDAAGFGTYRAADYEEATDHPFELGDFQRVDFEVDRIPHAFVVAGRAEFDAARLAQDATRICGAQRALFGHEPALDRYLFLARVTGAGYGGLEHRASSALICSRADLPRAGAGLTREYRTFLGLVSHEYFHLWNVKRITPQALAESDLRREAYTGDLWHYEGVTSYYDDLALLHAGVVDAATYLDLLAENATRLERTPGRTQQTLADASFEAWIKYYQPDENTPNATVSYYVKGSLAALCLDLTLRLRSRVTLDDILRELWRRFGREARPVPERGLEALAQELSGLDLSREFDAWLRSTQELPLEALLSQFGVQALRRAATGDADAGGRTSQKPAGATVGLKLRPGEPVVAHVVAGGPAQRAGVSGGDLLLALDGLRIGAASWPSRMAALVPGRELELHFFRGDELLSARLAAEPLPLDTWTFTLAEATGEVLERRKKWIGA